jgi:hypothetical protein
MATIPEIAIAMERLTNCMPPPRGVKPAEAFDGYVAALRQFRGDDINEAISRYLSGAFPKISAKFYPRAPELGACVRAVVAERSEAVEKERRQQALKDEREETARIEEMFRNRTDEQRARVAAAYDRFVDGLTAEDSLKAEARRRHLRERANIRSAYGMTDEALAAVPDRKLPKGMAPVAAAAPAPAEDEQLPW